MVNQVSLIFLAKDKGWGVLQVFVIVDVKGFGHFLTNHGVEKLDLGLIYR